MTEYEKVLESAVFVPAIRATEKQTILAELVDAMAAAGTIDDREAVLKAVIERERRMSTGMQFGVALPHGKTMSVPGVVAVIGLKREGVDFAALDGQPSRIFILTVSSSLKAGPHIQFLAEIGRLLNVPSFRERLLNVADRSELLALLRSEP